METIIVGRKDIEALVRRMTPALRTRCRGLFEDGFVDRLSEATIPRLGEVAAAMPMLSGDSPFRFHLTAAGAMIAMTMAMEAMGLPREEALGRLKTMGSRYYLGMPRAAGAFVRAKLFSRRFQTRFADYSLASSRREPLDGDWLFTINPGDGRSRTMLMDYSRCGIKVLCGRLGREDICPILCSLDFAMAEAFRYELRRTGTLGEGCASCDFAYRRK